MMNGRAVSETRHSARLLLTSEDGQDLAEYSIALFVLGLLWVFADLALPNVRAWRSKTPNVTVSAPEPVTVKHGSLAAIDAILQELPTANIAFSAPDAMYVDDIGEVELKLSPTHSIEELKEMIETEGNKEGATVKVSDRMEAHLSGSGFRVEYLADTAETAQAVSATEPTTWKWEIEARRAGVATLHLTLSAILLVDGSDVPRVIRTFDRKIKVHITAVSRITKFVGRNWQFFAGAAVFPLVAFGVSEWRRRDRSVWRGWTGRQ